VVLAAHGQLAAGFAVAGEEGAARRLMRGGVMAVAKRLAGQSAAATGAAVAEGGAEAWHTNLQVGRKSLAETRGFFLPGYPIMTSLAEWDSRRQGERRGSRLRRSGGGFPIWEGAGRGLTPSFWHG